MNNSLDMKINYWNLIKFALPTVIAQIFMGIYSMVDGIFVSNVIGTNALSSVNIVMPYVMVVLAFGVMIGTGGNAIISAQLGEGKNKEAKENFTFLCIICLIGCSLISILSIVFCEQLLVLLGASDLLMSDCINYAIPLFCVAPMAFLFMGYNMYASSLFTALGNGKISALISFFRGLVFLSIFVYVLPNIFGINGLFATMPVAEILGVILSLYFVLNKGKSYGVI